MTTSISSRPTSATPSDKKTEGQNTEAPKTVTVGRIKFSILDLSSDKLKEHHSLKK